MSSLRGPEFANGRLGGGLSVEIYHDPDVESPCEEEGEWRLHSFNTRHTSFTDPARFFRDGKPSLALRNKLRVGTAFVCSYFEHGNCLWLLMDEPRGALSGDWYWDGQDVAGVLVWEHPAVELGPRSLEGRRADARTFLQTYTSWCNGETYGYQVRDAQGEPVAGCGSFIGLDRTLEDLAECLNADDEVVAVTAPGGVLDLDDLNTARGSRPR